MMDLVIREGYPDFQDLPWHSSIASWQGLCPRLEEVQQGVSRHPVIFVNYDGILYAIKELPHGVAPLEYKSLLAMQENRLPSVIPVGYAEYISADIKRSILITRFLDQSLPYLSLFMYSNLTRYSEHLLDAIAGLLVQLHLAGVYWGDCSLSNTLFRRDAGALQAYLVDAETSEIHPKRLPPMLRHHDLQIMQENIQRDMIKLDETESRFSLQPGIEIDHYIRVRYQAIWEEVTREDVIPTNEYYRVQERIKALNSLGFSVKDVEMVATDRGNQLRMRIIVTDRNFHRDKLLELTGIDAEENQARQILNEIHELRAYLANIENRSTPINVASYHWLTHRYLPSIEHLHPLLERGCYEYLNNDPIELYCQVLEHKWYLSETAHHDVGHQAAVDDYVKKFSSQEC